MGAIIFAAALVFTFFPAYLDLFSYGWYWFLCGAWAFLGAAIFTCGCFIHWFNLCPGKKTVKAREPLLDAEGQAQAPVPYVMMNA